MGESYALGVSNSLQRRGKSTLALVDDAILVVVAIVGAIFLFKIIGFLAGALWFVLKLAVLAALVYGVLRVLKSRVR